MEEYKVIGLVYYSKNGNESNVYYYIIPKTFKINIDDRVYIKNGLGESLGIVTEIIEDAENTIDITPAVPKRLKVVDISDILEQEANVEKLSKIKYSLDSMVKKVEESKKYEILASAFPEAKSLLDEYYALTKKLEFPKMIESSDAAKRKAGRPRKQQ